MTETVVQDDRDTKTRILDAAERLMGEHGLDVPLRAITAEAGVNLAAVNYHFQSKDALIDAMVARRIGPINRRRLEMLDEIESANPSGRLPLEPVLEAFLAPVLLTDGIEHIRPLFGKVYSAPKEFMSRIHAKHLKDIATRFADALHRAEPELPRVELIWRLYLTVGLMVHVMNWMPLLSHVSGGLCDPSDTEAVIARVVGFAAAGFRSPLPDIGGA